MGSPFQSAAVKTAVKSTISTQTQQKCHQATTIYHQHIYHLSSCLLTATAATSAEKSPMGRSCDAQKRHTPTFKLDDHISLGTMHPNIDENRQTAVQFDDIFDVDGLPTATNQVNLPDTDDDDLSVEEIDPTGYQPNEEAQTSPHSTNPVQDSDEEMARMEEAANMV